MLKNVDKYENSTNSHFTYNDYKKKVKKRPNRDIIIFTSVFIVGVLIILGFAKVLSPNVDVGITNDNDTYEQDENYSRTSSVDERLKKLQMEDEGEMFTPELDEKVVIPKNEEQKTTVAEHLSAPNVSVEDSALNTVKTQHTEPVVNQQNAPSKTTTVTIPTPVKPTVSNPTTKTTTETTTSTSAPITNAKVVIGTYASEKQAEVAKSIMQDSGLGISPIIKNIGGSYTLQVGSFSSRDKAQQLTNSLIKSNYPARIIME